MGRNYPFGSVCGVEIELMIVDENTLDISSKAKNILDNTATIVQKNTPGISLSNELVQHVIEIKTDPPFFSPWQSRKMFLKALKDINKYTKKTETGLLGTGVHPWLLPQNNVLIWQWNNASIYKWYDRLFDCTRHGFSNLQSIHLNIPFQTDEEFEILHSVIRILLPLIPGLCASSPFLEGSLSGFMDTRLEVYKNNQTKYPIIAGDVIPESIKSEKEYNEKIFSKLDNLIETLNGSYEIESSWLNSRGAIARFDRGSIEIRLMDTQECLDANLGLGEIIFKTVKHFCQSNKQVQKAMQDYSSDRLVSILEGAIKDSDEYLITDDAYIKLFGFNLKKLTIRELWGYIFKECLDAQLLPLEIKDLISIYTKHGCLARRMLAACNGDYSESMLKKLYSVLYRCQQTNSVFTVIP